MTDPELILGDCVEAMAGMPDASVDAVVCDPPYGLSFMGKGWDNLGPGMAQMEWHRRWVREALRVLKPGGHLLAFGGTRCYHWLAAAVEVEGGEIRDSLHWSYGSGFPKSHNVGNAIDKVNGCPNRGGQTHTTGGRLRPMDNVPDVSGPYEARTDDGRPWEGWGTALKPAHEIVAMARKPLAGTVAANVLAHGVGGVNVDGCRVNPGESVPGGGGLRGGAESRHEGWRRASHGEGDATEPHASGRWPPNLLLTHDARCERVGVRRVGNGERVVGGPPRKPTKHLQQISGQPRTDAVMSYGLETIDDWRCVEGCPVAVMGGQSGEAGAAAPVRGSEPSETGQNGIYGRFARVQGQHHGDTGTAARFFPQLDWHPELDDVAPFLYHAKASRRERNAGCEGMEERAPDVALSGDPSNRGQTGNPYSTTSPAPKVNPHPCVKPVAVMRWLCRLVTPPGGTVLDPFMGSGSCGIAAHLEGFHYIGCEMEPEYHAIAEARIAHAVEHGERFAQVASSRAPRTVEAPEPVPVVPFSDLALFAEAVS